MSDYISRVSNDMKSLELKGTLGSYEIVKTDDGSYSLKSQFFDETCHSTLGAKNETIYNFIDGAKVRDRAEALDLKILEIGFGTGLGVVTTADFLSSSPRHHEMVSLELDGGLVEIAKHQYVDQPIMQNLKLISSHRYESTAGNFKVTILIGDARQTIKSLKDYGFNAVYQDAFSPKKNPALWTVEWFKDVKNSSSKDVVLSTYSAASSVRKSLIAAGFTPQVIKGFSIKKEATVAVIGGTIDPELLAHLNRSPVQELHD